MEEPSFPKPALDKFRQWHFWWLVVFSLLLITTFVYALPLRFLQQAVQEEAGPGHEDGEGMQDEPMMDRPGKDEALFGQEEVYKEESSIQEGLAVNLNISPVPYFTGFPLRMDFFVNQKPGNLPVGANQLQVEHERLMHVVGVRSDLHEFFHVHPGWWADNPAIFSIDHIFNNPGLYKIWSEIKKDGVNYSFGHPPVRINGNGFPEEKTVSFSRNVITDNYQVSLAVSDAVVKGRAVEMTFDIHTLGGLEVEVEPYLGADMHLAVIKDDWSEFRHTHPEGVGHVQAPRLIKTVLAHGGEEPAGSTDQHQTVSSGDEVIGFWIAFPEPGLYKAFAQFRPGGINLPPDGALTAAFWIQVAEKAPFPISQWWGLLAVSAVLIVGLSLAVNKYLKVKPEDIKINAK